MPLLNGLSCCSKFLDCHLRPSLEEYADRSQHSQQRHRQGLRDRLDYERPGGPQQETFGPDPGHGRLKVQLRLQILHQEELLSEKFQVKYNNLVNL